MRRAWKLQDAKNSFSNLVNEAQKEGPQIVTKRGVETVKVLSMNDYRKLMKPKISLVASCQEETFSLSTLTIGEIQKGPFNG